MGDQDHALGACDRAISEAKANTVRPLQPLTDHEHPIVRDTAARLTAGEKTQSGKIARLFEYVRNEIAFGFPLAGDLVKASDVIRSRQGQCNNKTTLFLALLRAAGIEARVHFSLIGKEIQRGLFTGLAYWLMPKKISHSWIEVEIDGRWRCIDAYINDRPFQEGAIGELKRRGWRTGFSVALPWTGEPASELDIESEKFVQMDAVTDDHGTWNDPADYFATSLYRNRPGKVKLWLYGLHVGRSNARVEAVRRRGRDAQRSGAMSPGS